MTIALPAPILRVHDGMVVDANPLAAIEVGRSLDGLIGTALVDLFELADRDAVARLLGEPVPTTSVTVSTAGADRRRVELRAAGDGDGRTVVVALRDRTEERLLHAVIDAVADSTLLLDPEGLVRWQSRTLGTQMRGGPEAGLGFNPLERIHPEDLPGVLDASAQVVAAAGTRVRHVARSRSVTDDDAWQLIEMTGIDASDDPDLGGFLIQVCEVEDAQVVDSLAEADGRFLSLADAAPVGILVSDRLGRTVYRNVAAKELLGEPDLLVHTDWRDLASGASRDLIDGIVRGAVDTGSPGSVTTSFEIGGQVRWLRVHIAPRRTASGSDPYLITTLEDVTSEIEAREATDRLTHMLDATSDYVAVFRPTGEILYVNAATRALLDVLVGEGAAGELADLIDDEPRRSWISAAMEELETTDVWQGNLELNTGGGQVIPVSAMGLIRRLPDGELDWVAIHARDISELKQAEHLLRDLASHDHLTGLANRALFTERLERAVAGHRRERSGVAVMFCDLDGFKAINDRHGHAAGDLVLSVIADRLRLVTRETDTTARVGGDEFVIVCERITDLVELGELAQRVIDAVNGPITLPNTGPVPMLPVRIRVGISVGVGVAGADHPEVDADRLLTLADTAMYRAKAAGGTTSVIDVLR